jgi:hypothetical protein
MVSSRSVFVMVFHEFQGVSVLPHGVGLAALVVDLGGECEKSRNDESSKDDE